MTSCQVYSPSFTWYCQVSATSRTDYGKLAQELGVTFFSDVNDLCEEHPDIVILASSILSAKQVLTSIPTQRLRRNTLFVDVMSVKSFPKQLMLAELPAEVCTILDTIVVTHRKICCA